MIPGRHVPAPSVALRKRVGFVGYVEPTLGEELLHVSKAEREAGRAIQRAG
jgi:hypothetical protein